MFTGFTYWSGKLWNNGEDQFGCIADHLGCICRTQILGLLHHKWQLSEYPRGDRKIPSLGILLRNEEFQSVRTTRSRVRNTSVISEWLNWNGILFVSQFVNCVSYVHHNFFSSPEFEMRVNTVFVNLERNNVRSRNVRKKNFVAKNKIKCFLLKHIIRVQRLFLSSLVFLGMSDCKCIEFETI